MFASKLDDELDECECDTLDENVQSIEVWVTLSKVKHG
jgi:hypothetical protein